MEREVLFFGLAADKVWIQLAAKCNDSNAFRRFRDAAFAEEVQIGTYLLVGFDLGSKARR